MVPGWSKGNHREIRGVPRDSVLLQVGRSLEGPSSSRGTQRVPVDPDASRRSMGVLGGLEQVLGCWHAMVART